VHLSWTIIGKGMCMTNRYNLKTVSRLWYCAITPFTLVHGCNFVAKCGEDNLVLIH